MSMDNMLRVCPRCGANIAAGFLFCTACGERMPTAPETQKTEPDPTRVTEREEKWSVKIKKLASHDGLLFNKLLLRAVALCVAALLLVFAFLPFGKTTFYDNEEEYTISFSTIDAIEFSVSSLSFMNDSEIINSKPYKELTELQRKLEYGVPSEQNLNEYLKLNYKLTLMHRDNAPRIGVLLAGVLSLTYLVLAVAFAILAAVSFALQLKAHFCSDKTEKPFFKAALKLMLVMLLLLPIIGYAFSHLVTVPKLGIFAYVESSGSVGVCYVLSLVFASLASGYICTCLRMSNKKRKTRENFTRVIKNYVSIGVVVLSFIALVIPAVTLRFKHIDEDSVDKASEYISLYELSEIGASELQQYANTTSASARMTIIKASGAALDGNFDEKYEPNTILNLINISYARMDISVMNTIIMLVTVALYIFLALLAWCILRKMFLEEDCNVKPFKVLSILLAIANTALLFVLAMVSDSCATQSVGEAVDVKIAVGPIIVLACVIAAAVFAHTNKDMTEYVEYDDADVSYAPYVVDYQRM